MVAIWTFLDTSISTLRHLSFVVDSDVSNNFPKTFKGQFFEQNSNYRGLHHHERKSEYCTSLN